jgi:general secretion pathway protein A
LLSRRLIVGLSPTQYDVALVANPALSPSELLDEVLSQFGLGLVRSKAARLQMLNERLHLNEQRGISSVLVVDEAQAIESINGFEALRLLTNFQLNDRYLLTVVLIGQPELRSRVGDIPQLNQRIAVRAHLGPFTAEETTAYITARMGATTDRTEVFTKEAMAMIFDQSRGVGRVINALCDQCLFAGAIEQVSQIDDRLVKLIGQVNNPPMPPDKHVEKVAESNELNQTAHMTDEQGDIYRQMVARLKPLEEELRVERDRGIYSAQRVAQLEEELWRVKELESMLAGEREQIARLNKKLAETKSATTRVEELESLGKLVTERVKTLERAFATEQERHRELGLSFPDAERASERAQMFESLLQMERALKTFWRDSYLKLNEPSG